jgi:ribonuclease VapC
MLVETSAIVAILLDEPEQDQFLATITADPNPITSVVAAVEAALGVGKEISDFVRAGEIVQLFLEDTGIKVQDIPAGLYQEVVSAYSQYGKGTGHPAKLNFGDCFSYALAKRAGIPLLYKGNDFSQTDLA